MSRIIVVGEMNAAIQPNASSLETVRFGGKNLFPCAETKATGTTAGESGPILVDLPHWPVPLPGQYITIVDSAGANRIGPYLVTGSNASSGSIIFTPVLSRNVVGTDRIRVHNASGAEGTTVCYITYGTGSTATPTIYTSTNTISVGSSVSFFENATGTAIFTSRVSSLGSNNTPVLAEVIPASPNFDGTLMRVYTGAGYGVGLNEHLANAGKSLPRD